jgi:hypothetical protein
VLLDAALLALLALASLLGALAGLLRPLFLFAGAAAGWVAARWLAAPLGRALAVVLPQDAARPVAAILLFAGVATAVALVGRRLSRNREGEGRPLDRGAGALLAGSAAAATAWVGLAVAEAVAPSLPPGWQSALSRSDLAGLVRENDLTGEWRRRADAALAALLHAASEPGAAARLSRDPELKNLLDDPRVRALVDEARATGRSEATRSADALRLLSDPDFRKRLAAAQERIDRSAASR